MGIRNQIVGVILAVGLFLALMYVLNLVNPPPKTPSPASPAAIPLEFKSNESGGSSATSSAEVPSTTTAAAERALTLAAGDSLEPVLFEGGAIAVRFNPRGASIDSIDLTAKNKKGHYQYRAGVKADVPYRLVSPVSTRMGEFRAFATQRLWVSDGQDRSWALDDLVWKIAARDAEHIDFVTELQAADSGAAVLRLTKTYRVSKDKPLIELSLRAENLGDISRKILIEQGGPVGVQREDKMHDYRAMVAAAKTSSGTIEMGRVTNRGALKKKAETNEYVKLYEGDKTFVWGAVADKYFGVFVRPISKDAAYPTFVLSADGTVADRSFSDDSLPDLSLRLVTRQEALAPGAALEYAFEIYAGPKDADALKTVNPAFVDPTKLNYKAVASIGQSCCTFSSLTEFMGWFLHVIQYVVGNFGVAIIVLVLIIRTLLHPLAVWQQKRMFRFQEVMLRLHPKMEDIKQRFASDKVKLQQETMKLYADEGVNPLAPAAAMLPMFIQLPLLGALWGALNNDILLRHAPFDGWWIRDLAAPDSFISFASPISIPILSSIPLIGSAFTNIPSINVLPILMGVSMYLQQKYMPKPAMAKKLEEARKQSAAQRTSESTGMSYEDQMRQQQVVANMMSVMFPLMFYYTPSGLSLYWMATNIFGICESLLIRRQIDEEHRRAEAGLVKRPPPRPPGFFARMMKSMAEQVDTLQKQADQVSDRNKRR